MSNIIKFPKSYDSLEKRVENLERLVQSYAKIILGSTGEKLVREIIKMARTAHDKT